MNTIFQRTITALALFAAVLLAAGNTAAETTITYLINDGLGSPIAAMDQQGAVIWRKDYQPYGGEYTLDPAATEERIGFTGHVHDSGTGLTYMGARYYDPVAGRFMSADPVGFDESNPMSFSRYAYANSNPYGFVDPDGRVIVIAAAVLAAYFGSAAIDGIIQSYLGGDVQNGQVQSLATIPAPAGKLPSLGFQFFRGTPKSAANSALKEFGHSVDDLSRAASQPINNTGLTRAARALDKHAAGQRFTGTFPRLSGSAAARNKQAQKIVDDILSNPKSEFKTLGRGGLQVRSPGGQGIRFDKDGSFSGLID